MVLLSDSHLLRMIKNHQLVIEPFDESMVHSAYIELRLGNKFTALLPESKGYLDPSARHTPLKQKDMLQNEPPITSKQKYNVMKVSEDGKFLIDPHEFILGTTKEKIMMPEGYIGVLNGKSSLGRLGVQVFCSGKYVDPKFKGHLILEIFNANRVPVALHPGMIVAKLAILPLSKTPVKEKVHDDIFDKEDMGKLTKWVSDKIAEG